ncbi:MAG: DUF262 domain-containing protein [Rhodospirillaceae bacterium]|nr:DUF262 domain-containing protein [Rhodospirillaceae bacterium]
MIEIRPEHVTLSELLERRLFQIPDYQRAYSWESRQRAELFEDIKRVMERGDDASHFMSTMVCRRKEEILLGTNRFHKLDVVDGQQRLTTLIILMNWIKIRLEQARIEEDELRDLSKLLVKESGRLLLLQTNHDASRHFSKFLREGVSADPKDAETLADRELLKAFGECKAFIEDQESEGTSLIDLYACIKNRLTFILYEIREEKLVYTVFEVLNSRGIEVSWFDRLKSIMMGNAFELENTDKDQLINELHDGWSKIYRTIGLKQGLSTEALRFAATLNQSDMPSRPLSERDSVDEFREKAHNSNDIRNIASWIGDVVDACDRVLSDQRQNAVTRISQARLLAVSIHLRRDIPDGEKKNLLERWEKISFRIYGMLGLDARYHVGEYVRLAWKIIQNNISVKSINSELDDLAKMCPVSEAVKALKNQNCYEGWQDELRYLMFRYEEYLAEENGSNFTNEQWVRIWEASPSKSIEHIMPQSKADDASKHRLGNLMLLPPGLNSKLQDKAFAEKRKSYRDTGLFVAQKVARLRQWSKNSIDKREKEILRWVKEEWKD